MKVQHLGGFYSRKNNNLYLLLKDSKQINSDHTIISIKEDDESKSYLLEWSVIGWHETNQGLYLLGEEGEYSIVSYSGFEAEGSINKRGVFTGLSVINDNVYIYGMGRTVYKKSFEDKWEDLSLGLDEEYYGTMSIAGTENNELTLVGWDGSIFTHEDDNKWVSCDSPVNSNLTSCLSVNEAVYVCGNDGVVLRGKNQTWEVINHKYKLENFWDLVVVNEKIFVASTTNIFLLKEDKLIPVLGWSLPESGVYCSSMYTPDGFWVFTEKSIFVYSNGEWTN